MSYTRGDGTFVSDDNILLMHEQFSRGISMPGEVVPGPAFAEFVRKVESGEIVLPDEDDDRDEDDGERNEPTSSDLLR